MAWFCNYYRCARCGTTWTDEWSAMCEDDCRACGARHMSPYDSDDLSELIVQSRDEFLVLRSPDSAESAPDYEEVGSFASAGQAAAHLTGR